MGEEGIVISDIGPGDIVIPGIGVSCPAIGCALVSAESVFVIWPDFAVGFLVAFFAVLDLGCGGIFIPGMFIGIGCATADPPSVNASEIPIRSGSFTRIPTKNDTPDRDRGCRPAESLAIAVSASAGIAATTAFAATAARASGICGLLLVFHWSFLLRCSSASESPYSFRTMVRSQAMPSLTIGKLAGAAGVGVETIRFYQRRGLLETPTRDEGIRRYGSDDVRRLRFIRQAQSAGFTLGEIKELLDLDASNDRARARQLANERVRALDARIAELKQARNALKRLAHECGSGSPGPCPILTSFDVEA
jgi:MerR family mercuric resistance operon transcriptional regulator